MKNLLFIGMLLVSFALNGQEIDLKTIIYLNSFQTWKREKIFKISGFKIFPIGSQWNYSQQEEKPWTFKFYVL